MNVTPLEVDPRLDTLFHPRSVAVIGASSRPERVGARVLRFLVEGGYSGTILPVNPRGGELYGLPCHPSIAALPEAPDLAVVAVEAAGTAEVIRDLGKRGVPSAICVAAGFRESGPEGAVLEVDVAAAARAAGVTLMGPNSAGIRHTATGLYATFATDVALGPLPGSVAVVSQSGGLAGYLGAAVTKSRGIGYRWIVDPGNEADVDVADCLAVLAHDPAVSVIGLITEGFGDGHRVRRALATAREQGKPVVALKIGTSEAGARAAASHTGALAGSDEVYDAAFRQHGVLRARDEHQFLAALRLHDAGRVPRGRGVAVFSLSGGVATLVTDLCTERDLDVPPLPPPPDPSAAAALPGARFDNPLDLTGQIGSRPDLLEAVLDHVLSQPQVDSAVLGFAYMLQARPISDVFVPAIGRVAAAHPDKPMIVTGLANPEAEAALAALGVPVEPLAIDAVDAIAAAVPRPVLLRRSARSDIGSTTPRRPDRTVITGPEAAAWLPGIPFVESRVVTSEAEALAAAETLGWPVVAKLEGTGEAHKTEGGLVRPDLADPTALVAAHRALAAERDRRGVGQVVVQPQVEGVEIVLGVSDDPTFGPVIMVGLGGVFVETLGDVAFGLPPLDRGQAERMVHGLQGFPLLDGARGRPRACVEELVDAVVALSDAALSPSGRLLEVDVNPFIVSAVPGRSAAVDVLLTRADGSAE